jgi:hypothetical protein
VELLMRVWQEGTMQNGSIFPSGHDERSVSANHPADTTVTISLDEASDLLHRFQTESAQVQAIFISPDGPSSLLRGILRPPLEGRYWCVRTSQEIAGSALSFDLLATIDRRFGDACSMPVDAAFPFRFRYESSLRFDFEDGCQLTLFELEDGSRPSASETRP